MDKKIIYSVHQPNFIPWLGYFDKINKSDIFVILDEVLIPRGTSVANKNKILTKNGVLEITFPIAHPKGNNRLTPYKDVLFGDEKAKMKLLKTIQTTYSKSPFFNEVYPFLENIFEANSFCELNINFIKGVCQKFGIKTEIILMSELAIEGNKNEMIVSIGKKINANLYLSGLGAKSYNDESYYNAHNILIEYQDYKPIEYKHFNYSGNQLNLSVLDYIFNKGFQIPF